MAVPDGTIEDVLAWVGEDQSRAAEAYLAEIDGKGRKTLLDRLDALANTDADGNTDAEADESDEPQYRARKRMQAQGTVYQPGDLVPPAASWTRVESYVRAGWLEEV